MFRFESHYLSAYITEEISPSVFHFVCLYLPVCMLGAYGLELRVKLLEDMRGNGKQAIVSNQSASPSVVEPANAIG